MEQLIIQLGGKQDKVAELFRSTGSQIKVGRGFNNDVVLSDHYIAPEQILLSQDEDGWQLEVLDDINPVKVNGKTIKSTTTLSSGDQLTLGRTHLVVYDVNHEVEPTQKLLSSWFNIDTIGVAIPIITFAVMMGIEWLIAHFTEIDSSGWKEFGTLTIGVIAVTGIWATIWAFIGKLLRHQGHFWMHVFIMAVIGILTIPLEPVGNYLEYVFSSTMANTVVTYVGNFLLFFLTLKLTFFFATNIKRINLVSFMTVGLITATYLGFQYFDSDDDDYSRYPTYSEIVKAPFVYFNQGGEVNEYVDSMDEVFEALDKEVAEHDEEEDQS